MLFVHRVEMHAFWLPRLSAVAERLAPLGHPAKRAVAPSTYPGGHVGTGCVLALLCDFDLGEEIGAVGAAGT